MEEQLPDGQPCASTAGSTETLIFNRPSAPSVSGARCLQQWKYVGPLEEQSSHEVAVSARDVLDVMTP